ncbi:MAG: TetR/AcrR family transcriptional regulator [Ruminococcus sp.]|nr:TetR/AcrR family transcriptional regulator [Ruminococcus sp.]
MKNDKKERILDAMQELMCRLPDKDISVSLIAKTADIAKGGVYYYFKSKDEILDAVVERCYKSAVHEFFSELDSEETALNKIKLLFRSLLRSEFGNKQKNLILTLHLHEDIQLHNKMKMIAVQEISPILTALLRQGCAEGSIKTKYPGESAEMIVAVITFFLDDNIFPSDNESKYRKLKIFAGVLDECLHATPGSFDFLYAPIDDNEKTSL